VDKVLAKIPYDQILNIALTKSTKLPALVNTGACAQAINLIDTEIMPVFDEYFGRKKYDKNLHSVFEIWMKTYLILANALVLQGNNRAFEVLEIVSDIIERYKIEDQIFVCKYKIALAAAYTMKGEVEKSDEIIAATMDNMMDSEIILRRNLVSVINRFIKKEYDGLQEQMGEIVMYAGHVGDTFTKNILKVLLGKLFFERGDSETAMKIYNEQVEYFAKEKQAIGALLSWYLIAQADEEHALEITIKAIEVAQNPNIDNYIFANLLNEKLLKYS
jgi:tetratricopeptide (TPR) repeat protein